MRGDDRPPDAAGIQESEPLAPPRRPTAPPFQLQSLSPRYDAEQHGVYVDALEQGLRTAGVRNIALTGPYGTGKSSVLAELRRRHPDRVIELSLSSVGEEPVLDAAADEQASTVTNRIQKEIVKQILYRDPPSRTRGSRFRRLAPLRFWRELRLALGVPLLALTVLALTTWSRPPVTVGDGKPLPVATAYLLLWLLLAAGWLLVRYATYGRLSLEKLSAGPATVSLTGQPTSYFDQYIDEIVFCFEQTGRDLVIFEDLDRFRDVHIFQSLRALNKLLNSAAQVQQRRRVQDPPRHRRSGSGPAEDPAPWPRDVVFVYALRDSVFERLGEAGDDSSPAAGDTPRQPKPKGRPDAAEQEVLLANRTKFFDLVVPVVPFITHRNARELMKEQMEGTQVGLPLIALAAQHVADQRLIIDLRNEFDIYANRLLHAEQIMPGLTADKLFAMLLYKSVHLADFEQIRFRRSRLDQLWDAWRELVAASIDDAQARDLQAAAALGREQSAFAHARILADRVDALAQALLGVQTGQAYSVQTPAGYASSEQLRTPAFWKQLADTRRPLALNGQGRAVAWPYDAPATVLDRPLRSDLWLPTHREAEQKRRTAAQAELQFLAHHTWRQIYDRADLALADGQGGTETFRQLTQRLLESRLAQDLVAAGFIDEYFALWVSMFYGRVASAAALDYMVHVLDRGKARIDYPLSAADVDTVLGDRGIGILGDRAAYNIAVLDRVLASGNSAVELMVRRIVQWDAADVRFVTRYLQRGEDPEGLVRRLAPRVDGMAGFVLNAAPPERRSSLVDAALAASSAPQLQPGADLAAYVLEHYGEFPSLSGDDWPPDEPTAAGRIVADGVVLPDVTMLRPAVLRQLATSGGYTAAGANLQAVSGIPTIALDVLRQHAPSVAELAVAQLPAYLEAVEASAGQQVTVLEPRAFAAELAVVAEATEDDALLERMVQLAGDECRLDRLEQAPPAAWRELLVASRTPPTAENLSAWVERSGAVAPVQAALTGVARLAEVEQLDQPHRVELALALLATALPAEQRVQLVEGLGLTDWLPVDRIDPSPGPLAALLLGADLVEDNEETFRRLVVDWPGREAAIAASDQFVAFVSPAVLPLSDLAAFFDSALPDAVKQQVLDQIVTWLPRRAPSASDRAGAWALRSETTPSAPVLQALAAAGASAARLTQLLAAQPGLSDEDFRSVLRSMGGDYALITEPGRKSPSFPNDAGHRALLERLQAAGTLGQIKPIDDRLRVWIRPRTD